MNKIQMSLLACSIADAINYGKYPINTTPTEILKVLPSFLEQIQITKDEPDSRDRIVLHNGTILATHPADLCVGYTCCIHNPSDHVLNQAPLNWRDDRKIMERICYHGIGHPDPDNLDFIGRTRGEEVMKAEGVHGCDGCCR